MYFLLILPISPNSSIDELTKNYANKLEIVDDSTFEAHAFNQNPAYFYLYSSPLVSFFSSANIGYHYIMDMSKPEHLVGCPAFTRFVDASKMRCYTMMTEEDKKDKKKEKKE